MRQKFLNISSLALLQIIIVGNLQILPVNASYGAALPFLYLLAVIGFFLPCTLMTAELATTRPQTGGAYIWCEQAFGAKMGFFTVCILWISNLLWYPSIFSLIAANVAYLFNVSLVENKFFIIGLALLLFWFFTGLNCVGVKFSSRLSAACSVIGIIFPMLVIIAGGFSWWLTGKPLAISFNHESMLPDITHIKNLGLLIAIAISLFGMEMTAVHAGNVVNPKRDYPRSLFISSIGILLLLMLSELSIAAIIPLEKLSVMTGLLDSIVVLFQEMHLNKLISIVLLLVLIGNIGSVAAWMLSSTRGMYVACQKNHVAPFLQKVNRYESPIGVLIFEAVIFTLVSSVFLLFPRITDSFWILLDLASQITLVYYIVLFISAIRLRYLAAYAKGFVVPGGNLFWWVLMCLGVFTSLLALCAGFIAPDNLSASNILLFKYIIIFGLGLAMSLPLFILLFSHYSRNRHPVD